ncbi:MULTISPECIES: ammonia-dependent NAD(+) synthetase [Modicisalibacter]|uniref:ammonia-dependent NAD(+) synthetase n=1 Tax=Modicisalibacter TaxID=574347 RepID=UPI00100C0E3D|nr:MULTISPECIES: ammonia-dependent NAD(+) synthetase [Halomonadaceae]MBZ9557978.1 ammonia-dependent NAD(+) synthetase [Modicisalibacter sp. R2A 31.J]MBZ9573354.1 ammonia-dependent NAD(+) synthetase [Modicisalibacter sp. MOD 31.J]
MSNDPTSQDQRAIAAALGVETRRDPAEQVARRLRFLEQEMRESGQHALVLGISGGIDSTVAGRLSQLAVEAVRDALPDARFWALRLPYGTQKDDDEAAQALDFIAPDEVLTVDIQPASDAMLESLETGGVTFRDDEQRDFVMGNIKARQRMIAQYAVAGTHGGLVVGTDQAAEAVMGFFTKFGDGACDLTPLAGLTKGQVRDIASHLGAPQWLVDKVPTADLESLRPQRSDEDALGVSYEAIDRFLSGETVADEDARTIIAGYRKTEHKRRLPKAPD